MRYCSRRMNKRSPLTIASCQSNLFYISLVHLSQTLLRIEGGTLPSQEYCKSRESSLRIVHGHLHHVRLSNKWPHQGIPTTPMRTKAPMSVTCAFNVPGFIQVLLKCRCQGHGLWDLSVVERGQRYDRDGMKGYRGQTRD